MYPPAIERLIKIFTRFPTVGIRTATRFAFHCLDLSPKEIDELISGLEEVKKSVKKCKICFRSHQEKEEYCSICSDKRREKSVLCVVEKEVDLVSVEKIKEYKGIYFILGGTVSPLKKHDFKKIRGKELKQRITNHQQFNLPPIKEVIIATNQNTQGEATALYLMRALEPLKIKISRLGKGLPTGGELEYADEETLSSAFKRRL